MKTELTDRLIRNIDAPAAGRLEVSDAKRPGLRLRVSPQGKKVWMFEKRVKGGSKRKHTLGTWPGVSLADARAIALEIEVEAGRGIDRVADERTKKLADEAARASMLSVREVINLYTELHLSQLRTGNERKRQLEQALELNLSAHISELTHKDLQRAVDAKLLEGKAVSANRVRAALVAFVNWAWVRGYLPEHIGLRITKPTREAVRERVLSLDEVQTIYDAANMLGTLWGPFVRLLILTGQRRGEVAALRWEEIDLGAAKISKSGTTTKNRKTHVTHLSAPALAELLQIEGDRRGFIFTTTGYSPVSGFSVVKRRLGKILGPDFAPWRFHDIRTAMATALAEAGESETVVDRILNHVASGSAPSAVARVYNQAEQMPQRARALDRWAEMVTGVQAQVISIGGRRDD